MCTVTVVPTRETVRLACNRDELRSRRVALPPRILHFGQRRAILPLDPASGGTWVAVNDAGLTMTVLNVNQEDSRKDTTDPPRSRGTIILHLLHCDTLVSALSRAAALDPTLCASFRLVIADHKELAEFRSDGRRVWVVCHTAIAEPLFFTSSGLGDHLVEEPRRHLFADLFSRPGDLIAWQEVFHRHHWPERPHLSVCMRREEARTVSHTVVSLGRDRVTLTYHPDAPDQLTEPVALSLDLRTGGA
jgi:Transport and Golgi organisation 2